MSFKPETTTECKDNVCVRLRCRKRWLQTMRCCQNRLSRLFLWGWKHFSIRAPIVNIMLALLPVAFTTCSYFPFQRIQIGITRAHQMATAEWFINLQGIMPTIYVHVTMCIQSALAVWKIKINKPVAAWKGEKKTTLWMHWWWNKLMLQWPHISTGCESGQQNHMKEA